ncbi:hypothetical protein NEUTE2DRAFT_50846, partial [Neurospora tetrasperma FGSC 2509]
DLLTITEFIYNNTISLLTGLSLFYTNYKYYPTLYNPLNSALYNPGNYLYIY